MYSSAGQDYPAPPFSDSEGLLPALKDSALLTGSSQLPSMWVVSLC